jgi:hypothetical protein
VIVLAVRWYLRFSLSYRDVEELLAERGIEVDHVTIYRWVLRFTRLLAEAARPCRHAIGNWYGRRWMPPALTDRLVGLSVGRGVRCDRPGQGHPGANAGWAGR